MFQNTDGGLLRCCVTQNLEGIAAAAVSNSSDKLNELAPRNNAERARLQEEIAELKQQLAHAVAAAGSGGANVQALENELHDLQADKETV